MYIFKDAAHVEKNLHRPREERGDQLAFKQKAQLLQQNMAAFERAFRLIEFPSWLLLICDLFFNLPFDRFFGIAFFVKIANPG